MALNERDFIKFVGFTILKHKLKHLVCYLQQPVDIGGNLLQWVRGLAI